jgi:hypothetical protein
MHALESPLLDDKDKRATMETTNKMHADGAISTEDVELANTKQMPAPMVRQPSAAYKNSKRLSEARNVQLGSLGMCAIDFEYKEPEGEDDVGEVAVTATPYKKLKKIGKKTTCMAFCLTGFGLAMIITSFVVVNRISGSHNAFYLFLIIGICAFIPGSYATYHVIGKFLGWPGFQRSLISYDLRGG